MSDGRVIRGPEALATLRVAPTGTCWWCQARPATTGEHKFKAADLTRLMAEEGPLLWGDSQGAVRTINGRSGITRDRYGVIKFPKSLCEDCNNSRSKPFDNAYDTFSNHLRLTPLRDADGVNFAEVFGVDWKTQAPRLARYYAKHFGCRMVRSGLPVPSSLRDLLDGASTMADAQMALITTDSVHESKRDLSISPDFAAADKDLTRLVQYVLVAYVGAIGVRYEWCADGLPPDRTQFFHFPYPVITPFEDEMAVVEARPRPQNVWPSDQYDGAEAFARGSLAPHTDSTQPTIPETARWPDGGCERGDSAGERDRASTSRCAPHA